MLKISIYWGLTTIYSQFFPLMYGFSGIEFYSLVTLFRLYKHVCVCVCVCVSVCVCLCVSVCLCACACVYLLTGDLLSGLVSVRKICVFVFV